MPSTVRFALFLLLSALLVACGDSPSPQAAEPSPDGTRTSEEAPGPSLAETFTPAMIALPEAATVSISPAVPAPVRSRIRFFQTQQERKPAGESVEVGVKQGPGALIFATAEEGPPLLMGVFYGDNQVALDFQTTAQALVHMRLNSNIGQVSASPELLKQLSRQAPSHRAFVSLASYTGRLVEQGGSVLADSRAQQAADVIAQDLLARAK